MAKFRDCYPILGGTTADGGFFSPVENAYWRGFSRVCVDYNTAASGKKRVVFLRGDNSTRQLCPMLKRILGESAMTAIQVFAPACCGGAV